MQKKGITTLIIVGIIFLLIFSAYGKFKSTYNSMVILDEGVKASWSQVENVYQRRLDLIPNLVSTVKGYATHEEETFTKLAEARSKAGGSITISEEVLNDPALFQKFQEAQAGLGGALQRLMMVTESYPELKASESFLALQSQLEGTENRITVERKRFNDTVQGHNTYIKTFPTNIMANMFGFRERSYFESSARANVAPTVEFGN
ncbi:MAG: LemA family protein [Spirochaetaceae bacterium]